MAAVLVQPASRSLPRPTSGTNAGLIESLAVVIPFPGTVRPPVRTPIKPAIGSGDFIEDALAVSSLSNVRSHSVSQSQAQAHAQAGKMRLTTRGWIVLSVLGLIAAVVIGASLGMVFEPQLFDLSSTQAVTVQSGDTLWSLASSVALPQHDVRDVIEVIKDLNGLPSSALSAGQQILLPVATQ